MGKLTALLPLPCRNQVFLVPRCAYLLESVWEAMRLWQGASILPLLTSFKTEALVAAKQAAPFLPRGLLLHSLWDGWLETALDLECVAIVCNYQLWNQELVATVHAQRMQCLSYTVNDPDIADSLIALGTDGIITDSVDKLGA